MLTTEYTITDNAIINKPVYCLRHVIPYSFNTFFWSTFRLGATMPRYLLFIVYTPNCEL